MTSIYLPSESATQTYEFQLFTALYDLNQYPRNHYKTKFKLYSVRKPDELYSVLSYARRAATMSEMSGESMLDAESLLKRPKRVILRLRVDEFDDCNPTEFDSAIMAYLASAGRPVDELQQRIHHSHTNLFSPQR
ncbi:hypothetical protein AJ78_00720 [Emergomyces pasteurianus Ep9510]|uniref:Uncharacterized protein n=1 Tax=Emergomyces pasteurianus Ep9510 TaxID=1447872 RepID=A0A1J9PSW5_9EURO|nr:hypothetical protein AJ78_00720 [Emergomyces pasteurianus Ep9510]